jgi:hypothetical protein
MIEDLGTGGTNANITSVIATSTADAIVPTVTAQKQVSLSSVVANASSDAIAPSITTESINSTIIDAVIATALLDAIIPNIKTTSQLLAPEGLARLRTNERLLNAVRNLPQRR